MKIDKYKISSFALAVFICANSLAWLQLFPNMLPVLVTLSFLIILKTRHRDFSFGNKGVYIVYVITIIYYSFFLTLFHSSLQSFSNILINFTVLCLPGLIISNIQYDFKRVLKYILMLFSLTFVYLINIKNIILQQEDIFGFLMGISYGILPYALVSIYFILSKNVNVLLKTIAMIVFITCMGFMMNFGSRGPQVAITVFFLYLVYIRFKQNKKVLYMLFTSLIVGIFLFKLFLLSGDTGIYFLDKMAHLSDKGDASNGRFDLYKYALDMFAKNPIMGNGINTFTVNGELTYPHNVFIQMLYESGIIYTTALCIPIIAFAKRIYNKNLDDHDKTITMFFLCVSLVGLMLSSYYWIQQTFWLIIGFGISYSNKHSMVIKRY